MRCWAIVPARGGSKGIPRKNLQKVGGVPLIARAVAASVAAKTVERVFVTTDDDEIAAVALAAGAELIRRPQELASDVASSEDALLHALGEMERRGEVLPETIVFVQCTSPFVQGGDIDGVVQALDASGADCAITASEFHGFIWRAGKGSLEGVNHDGKVRQRRQDREPELLENGAAYALRVPAFRRVGQRFCGPVACFEMPAARSMEIDSHQELEIAQHLAVLMGNDDALLAHAAAIVFDFDGVMTDNKVLVSQDGTESVICSRSDGMGIGELKALGLPLLILSKERNPVVTARARKLDIECQQGVDDKKSALVSWTKRVAVDLAHVTYVGNDINDIPCLECVGMPVVVGDAHPAVLPYARLVLAHPGGDGAVREVCDRIQMAKLVTGTRRG